MPATIDPTRDMPVIRLAIAVTGVTWAKVPARTHNRRCGVGPTKAVSRQILRQEGLVGHHVCMLAQHACMVRMLHTLRLFAVAMAGSGELDPLDG